MGAHCWQTDVEEDCAADYKKRLVRGWASPHELDIRRWDI